MPEQIKSVPASGKFANFEWKLNRPVLNQGSRRKENQRKITVRDVTDVREGRTYQQMKKGAQDRVEREFRRGNGGDPVDLSEDRFIGREVAWKADLNQ